MNHIAKDKEYQQLVQKIGTIFYEGKKQAAITINQILIHAYWEIGRQIITYEQENKERAKYGSRLLERLSKDLSKDNTKGFSVDNLENMRKFYLHFKNSEALSRKLSWSHYCLLIRISNPLARSFYIIEAEKEGWSIRELERQINSMLFERIGLSKNKEEIIKLSKTGQIIEKADDIVKDPYILDFLDIEQNELINESYLEKKLISNLKMFLLELGKGFMFVESQKRIMIEGGYFFIDLVFYNRLLRCFVLIELKNGKLRHKDIGQLQMYVNYFDRKIKSEREGPTIGILLCTNKNDAIVKYTLPKNNRHIFASKYQLYLPNKKQLELKLRGILQGKISENRKCL